MKEHKFWLRVSKTDKNIPDGMIVGPFSNVVGSFITAEKISVFGRISNSIIKCNHLIINDGGYVSGVVNSDQLEVHDGGTLDAQCYISPDRTITPVINGISIDVIIQNSINKNNLISLPPKSIIEKIQVKYNQELESVLYEAESDTRANPAKKLSILGDLEKSSCQSF